MFSKLQNLFTLFPFLVNASRAYYFPKNDLRHTLGLHESEISNLDEKLVSRIEYYIFLNRMINESFAILRDIPLSKDEEKLGALIGAFTPVYDDLMDDYGYSHEALLDLQETDTPIKRCYIAMLDRIKKLHPNTDSFFLYFNAAGVAQNESILLQRDKETSVRQLRRIMNVKGGNFCLLFRSALSNELSKEEERAIYQLGGLTQYVNDIFDVYKDFHQGTYTIPIKLFGDSNLKKDYKEEISKCYHSINSTSFKEKSKRKFWLQIYSLLSRGYLALEQYDKNRSKEKCGDLASIDRKLLICDMEKPSSVYKNIIEIISWKEN